jgi:hypothetical protein
MTECTDSGLCGWCGNPHGVSTCSCSRHEDRALEAELAMKRKQYFPDARMHLPYQCWACGENTEHLNFLGRADDGFLLCEYCTKEAAYRYYRGPLPAAKP